MAAITKEAAGRYRVHDEKRTYGVYRTLEMAIYRAAQVKNSRREPLQRPAAPKVA